MSQLEKAILLKERIVYELAIALGIDPDNEDIDQIEIPESFTTEVLPFTQSSRHNIYVALKRNYQVLKKMKESLNSVQ
jgi:hypothetical protein